MTYLYFQRGYDKLDIKELQTSINETALITVSTYQIPTTSTILLYKLTLTSNQTITLPQIPGTLPSLEGRIFIFIKTQSGGTVTIEGYGSQTINGALNTTLTTQYQTKTVICDGSSWLIV